MVASSNAPLVCISMVTYNHENYISQAIESVLMQQTNFTFKLIIGEDCSTDNTRGICQQYKEKYPEKIELVTYEKNVGSSINVDNIYRCGVNSGAKYVALLEGDDYWIDKCKLQKQVDLLEKNPECSICYTNLNQYTQKNGVLKKNIIERTAFAKIFIDEYISKGGYMPTLTVMFKASFYPEKMPDWFLKVIKQDWFVALCLLRKGPSIFLNESTGVYRVHEGGLMHTKKVKLLSNSLFMVENTKRYLYPEYQKVFADIVSWHASDLAFAYLQNGDWKLFFETMMRAIKSGERKSLKWYGIKLRHALRIIKTRLIKTQQ